MEKYKEKKEKTRKRRSRAKDKADKTIVKESIDNSARDAKPEISVSILSLSGGMEVYENVAMIRIVSDDYNLLIMKDYMSTIGKVKGNVQIVGDNVMKSLDEIEGYYVFRQNQFELLIEEDMYVK